MTSERHHAEEREWLAGQIDGLTDYVVRLLPSEWAEQKRYLPPALTDMPGFYSFDVGPYIREILDCLAPTSPVREIDCMKGVQICATVGILENAIGYYIEHVSNAPMMMVTADDGLSKLRMDTNIIPMLNYSELDHLIKSSDEKSTRKTGKTDKKLEWAGGGFLVPFGANSANKLRSTTIRVLLEDEVDGWPLQVGKQGDPQRLVEDRTAATETSRKILRISTPLEAKTSRINKGYLRGDQRKFFVPCKHCGEKQVLEWNKFDKETGAAYGLHFDHDNGRLIEDSVRYICKFCGGEHVNDDKAFMLPRGEWRPTAEPSSPNRRSYHISGLYSPVGMRSWTECCRIWLDAWDPVNERAKDNEILQVFYNNVLARVFEKRGDNLKLERVRMHRRPQYASGVVPNTLAVNETGGPIQFLTCAVDVHKRHLDAQVIGWTEGSRGYSIEWKKIEGEDCRRIDDSAWSELQNLIESSEYVADDGKKYNIQVTLIDTQYEPETVLSFCSGYSAGVYPIQGRNDPVKSARFKEFSPYETQLGIIAFHVNVALYKDRLSTALRREWGGEGLQPERHMNFPGDYTDQFFKELTVEYKVEVVDEKTGQHRGYQWHRPGNAANHAWDLTVYNLAALDMVMFDVCTVELGLESLDRLRFWQHLRENPFWY